MTFWWSYYTQRLLDRQGLSGRNPGLISAGSRRHATGLDSNINERHISVSHENPAAGIGWHSQLSVYDSIREITPSLSLMNGTRKRKATDEVAPRPVKKARETGDGVKPGDKDFLASCGFGDVQIPVVPKNSFLLCTLQVSRRQEHLLNLYSQYVTVNKADKRECVAVVCDILAKLMEHVQNQDGGQLYSASLLKAGSYAIKTKIGKADEFDWLVPLNVMVRKRSCGYWTISPMCYKTTNARPVFTNSDYSLIKVPVIHSQFQPALNYFIEADYIPTSIIENGYIRPRLLKKDLHEKLRIAIKATNLEKKGVYLSPGAHGPALTLTIVRTGKHNISIDVTPSLPSDVPVTTNGWPSVKTRRTLSTEQINETLRAGTHFVPKEDSVFTLSYSKAETSLCKRIDGRNECRKMCHKVIKKYVKTFISKSPRGAPGISSYIFKHQLLHMNEELSGPSLWHTQHFGERMVAMLKSCERVLRLGRLQNYFNASENILAGKDYTVLNALADYFRDEYLKLMDL